MEENINKNFKVFSNKDERRIKLGFVRGILVPLISGIVGCSIVIASYNYIPAVKNIFASSNTEMNINSKETTNINYENISQVALKEYSDTSIYSANKILPSIVGITVEYNITSNYPMFGGKTNTSSAKATGSGIIISEDGYILTNNHIVSNSSDKNYYQVSEASKVSVKLFGDENEYEAKIVGTDEQTDLAVIKIEKNGLVAAEFADSDSIKVGEFAMAVGNPLGMSTSVTVGVVSAINVEITDSDNKKYNLIQTDAAINSGNSGGALVNSEGKVLGINTMKVASTGVEGMGFAIPINTTIDITEQLIQYSKVKRPYIGIGGRDLDEKTAKTYNLVLGVYVASIEDFSAAEKAGLKIGDVIIEADGNKITSMDELNNLKNKHQINDEFKLKINRNGEEKYITIILDEQP